MSYPARAEGLVNMISVQGLSPQPTQRVSIKQSDGEVPVMLELWEMQKYPFIAIAPRSTPSRSGSTWESPIYGSNRTVWHLNWVQTNNFCWTEVLEIELFDCLTACKEMNDILIDFFVIHSNTWKHLSVCKRMSFGSFENVINKMFTNHIYIWYICIKRIWH